MFERFTDAARRVVVLAQEESRMLGHTSIGTEHLLLGLVHEGDGVAARALEDKGVTLDRARTEVAAIAGEGARRPSGHIPFTPRAKHVMELSLREALRLKHSYIGTEHLLLGLLHEGAGVGVQTIQQIGVDPDALRQEVLTLLRVRSEDVAEAAGETSRPGVSGGSLFRRAERGQLSAENAALRAEVARLRLLLRQHGIEQPRD